MKLFNLIPIAFLLGAAPFIDVTGIGPKAIIESGVPANHSQIESESPKDANENSLQTKELILTMTELDTRNSLR